MKHPILLSFLTLSLVLLSTAPEGLAGEYQGKIAFSLENLERGERDGFDIITYKNMDYTFAVGAPHLPHTQINVAIPTDAAVLEVRVLNVKKIELEGLYDIMPNAAPIPCSAPAPADPFNKDFAIYEKNADYPGTYAEIISSWDLVGQDFVTLNIYPVQYNPVTRKVSLATHVDYEVVYREATNPLRETYNFSTKVKNWYTRVLGSMAVNPMDVSPLPNYIPPLTAALTPGDYEYVIITTTAFKNAFQPLADWRTQMGMPATIIETTWIYSNYTGTSNQERIRNFIIDANATWGSLYFLMGGDTSYVPHHIKNVGGTNIPNDTYYSDWDDDWKCELFVGRAPVTSTSLVNIFVNKVLNYEKNPPANHGNKVFFMGFDLDNSTPTENTKKGIKNSWVPFDAIYSSEYDSESGGHESDVKAYLNQGQNLVNHSDHSDTDIIGVGSVHHNTYLTGAEAQNFVNGQRLTNMYSIGCYAGNYANNCWGEKFVRDDQGGITFVGNSRYGWYQPGAIYSYSLKYDQKWWETLYDFNMYRAGTTLAKSLNKYYPADSTLKYVFTELNLQGDPGLHMWTQDPVDLTVAHDATINTGAQTFIVNVKDNGLNVEEALVCVMKDSEVYAYEVTDVSGNAALAIDPATTGTMTVTVTGQNYKVYEGSVSVQAGVNPPTITSISPRCGLDAGGTTVSVTGTYFTTNPATTVRINGVDCTLITVNSSTTITCVTPSGTNGWYDVEVSSTAGSDSLTDGFRYFPAGGAPFNAADIHTESLDTPVDVTLIASGLPGNPFVIFLSFGDGPISTPYGTMGLDFPIMYMGQLPLNGQGYFLLPATIDPGLGPVDFYLHFLGLDSAGNPAWSYGGNTPNGSGSVWLHLNN